MHAEQEGFLQKDSNQHQRIPLSARPPALLHIPEQHRPIALSETIRRVLRTNSSSNSPPSQTCGVVRSSLRRRRSLVVNYTTSFHRGVPCDLTPQRSSRSYLDSLIFHQRPQGTGTYLSNRVAESGDESAVKCWNRRKFLVRRPAPRRIQSTGGTSRRPRA